MTFRAKWHFSMIDRRPVVPLAMTFWPDRLPRSSFSSIFFSFYFIIVKRSWLISPPTRVGLVAYCLVRARHGIRRGELNIADRAMLTDARSFIRG